MKRFTRVEAAPWRASRMAVRVLMLHRDSPVLRAFRFGTAKVEPLTAADFETMWERMS